MSRSHSSESVQEPLSAGKKRPWRRLVTVLVQPAIAGTLLLISLTVYVLRSYYIKPYSDPLNWLTFAQDLGTTSYLSKFPIGYPIFLHVISPLVGPYYVFLSNLPILLLLVVLVGIFAKRVAELSLARDAANLAGSAAMLFVVFYAPALWTYLTNPYRDPLSYLLLMSGVLLFMGYVRNGGRGAFRLILSGLLLGFAFSVRETSLLVLPFMCLYGLIAYLQKKIPFWKSVLLFGVFLALGMAPLFVQAYLRTGQAFVPPQSAVEGRLLPGLHLIAVKVTFPRAARYFLVLGNAWLILGLIWGTYTAGRTRNTLALLLSLGCGLGYFAFYSFYWTFVPRYFFVVPLFLLPIVTLGLIAGLERACQRYRPRWQKMAPKYLVLLLLLGTLGKLLGHAPGPDFRIHEAKEFTREMRACCPTNENALVLSPRHLCEVLSYFVGVDSHPLPADYNDEQSREASAFQALQQLLQEGRDLYYMEVPGKWIDRQFAYVKRLMNQVPIVSGLTAKYHLERAMGPFPFTLYHLQPWNAHTTRVEIVQHPRKGDLLRINAQSLYVVHPDRSYARLYLNGRLLDDDVQDGANYYNPDWDLFTAPYVLELTSDRPVPAVIDPALISDDEPLVLDFSPSAASHMHMLKGFRRSDIHQFKIGPLWSNQTVSMDLPVPLEQNREVQAVIVMRVARGNIIVLDVLSSAKQLGRFRMKGSLEYSTLPITLPPEATRQGRQQLELHSTTIMSSNPPPVMEMDSIHLHRASRRQTIELGSVRDEPYVASGVHKREHTEEYTMRWTQTNALFDIWIKPMDTDYRIRALEIAASRPTNGPDPEVRFVINDRELEPIRQEDIEPKRVTWEVVIPRAAITNNHNDFHIICTPWVPAEVLPHSWDHRELGILLDRIEVDPAVTP